MTADIEDPNAEEGRLDSTYRPFPALDSWRDLRVPAEVFAEAVMLFEESAAIATPEQVAAVVDFGLRAAAFDTGAIEDLYDTDRGITFSVAARSIAWEERVEEKSGDTALRHFQTQLAAYDWVLDAATGRRPITEVMIRELHEQLTGAQDTYRVRTAVGWQNVALPKGVYKSSPNHVRQRDGRWHSYAPVAETPEEIRRLVADVRSPDFEAVHPIVRSAYLHYALTYVHPFADGNGRVARALASVPLYRVARIPFLVFRDERARYFASLEAADGGDLQRFVTFVADRAVDTVTLLRDELDAARRPGLLAKVAELGSLIENDEEPSRIGLDAAARRLGDVALQTVTDVVEQLSLPRSVRMTVTPLDQGGHSIPSVPTYQYRYAGNGNVGVTMRASVSDDDDAAVIHARQDIAVLIITSKDSFWRFRLVGRSADPSKDLPLRLDHVYPQMSETGRRRITYWAQQVVDDLVSELNARLTG